MRLERDKWEERMVASAFQIVESNGYCNYPTVQFTSSQTCTWSNQKTSLLQKELVRPSARPSIHWAPGVLRQNQLLDLKEPR